MSHERLRALTNDALLQRNVLVNIVAWALPAVAALVSIPILANSLGAARFGLLTFAWAVIGVGALSDLGIGRTLTRLIAVRLTSGREREVGDLVWSASWVLFALTAVVTIVGWVLAPVLTDHVLKVSPQLRRETIGTVRLLAVAFPIMAHGITLRGVLEAGQLFPLSAKLRVPMSVVTYAGPILAIPFGGDIRVAVGVILIGRLLYWVAHLLVIGRVVPGLGRPRALHHGALREVLDVGRWIILPSVFAPIVTGADRIAVAAGFPIVASGWYGTAAELATKPFLFTGALQPVLYPALAASYQPDPDRAVALMWKATWITMLVTGPAAFVLAALARPLIRLWMRGAYAPEAALLLPWIAIAVFISTLTQVPFAMLQGAVDARRTGLLIVAELPIYVVLLVVFGQAWGVIGIAYAALTRMAIDAVGQWAIMAFRFPASRSVVRRTLLFGVPGLGLLVVAALFGAH